MPLSPDYISPDDGNVSSTAGDGPTHCHGFSAFMRYRESLSSTEEVCPVPASLDVPSKALYQYLAPERAKLAAMVEKELREYDAQVGVGRKWAGQKTRSFVEHYWKHYASRQLRSAIKHFFTIHQHTCKRSMMDRSRLWKVVGGQNKRDLIVRTGPSPSWPKLPEKLAVGAWMREQEALGDRIRYRLLWGSGPKHGWVSVMLREEALAERVAKLPVSVETAIDRKSQKLSRIRNLDLDKTLLPLANGEQVGKIEKALKDEKPQESESVQPEELKVVTAKEAQLIETDLVVEPQKPVPEHIVVIGLMAAHLTDAVSVAKLHAALVSVEAQEVHDPRAEFVFVLSWSAREELVEAAVGMLERFSHICSRRSWVCQYQRTPRAQVQHFSAALAVGEAELRHRGASLAKKSIWAIFGDGSDLWDPRRVDSYVNAIRKHSMVEGVGAFASVTHVNVDPASASTEHFMMPELPEDVTSQLDAGKLCRTDSREECKEWISSLSSADSEDCKEDAALDLPLELFDFCARQRIVQEFFEETSDALLAHRACDLKFLEFLRNYTAYGREIGLEVSLFQPDCWMYFCAKPGSSSDLSGDMMSDVRVVLRSTFGTRLAVGVGGQLCAMPHEAGERQQFVRVDNDDGTFSLLSFEGLFLSVDSDGYIHASATPAGRSALFDMIDICDCWTFSLFSIELQRYVVVAESGEVRAMEVEDIDGPPLCSELIVEVCDESSGRTGAHRGYVFVAPGPELHFTTQEKQIFAEIGPSVPPEKLLRSFASFRRIIEMTLIGFHRKIFDQPEFDCLTFEVAHMAFPYIFYHLASLRAKDRNSGASKVYEACTRFGTVLAFNLDVQILWHDCARFLVPGERTLNVWLKYRRKTN